MKTFKTLDSSEATARLKNFLAMHFKFTVQEIDEKLICMRLTHGEERISDLAFYVQYAMIKQVEFFDILQTVYHDFMLYNKKDTPFKSFCYTFQYETSVTMTKYPKRQNVIELDLSPINEPFDEIEIHPCHEVGNNSVEQCDPEEAEFFSVYVHLVEGGLCCIADFITEIEAETFKVFLNSFIQHSAK